MKGWVILVGMPGSGKTVVGQVVAERLGSTFVDLDTRLEADEGASVPELFASRGEAAFRVLESACLKATLSGSEGGVLAPGGGSVVSATNQALFAKGSVVFLDVPVEALQERVEAQGGRPLIGSDADVERLLEERAPIYGQVADVTVSGIGSPQDVADRVVAALEAGDA